MAITPYMNLDLPVVGPNGTVGPTWASKLNIALTKVDTHDHSTGNGSKIPSAGLNINADLSFGGFNATQFRSVRFTSQSAALATSSDKGAIYVVSGNLYYNNASGTAIQLTSGSGLNLSSLGTIGGDFSTSSATVTYSDTSKSYLFKQDSTKTGDIACGSIFFYENATSANYNKLQSAASLSSNLTFTWFSALPASTLPVVLSSSGAFSTQQIATAQIADLAIDNTKLKFDVSTDANRAVTTDHIRDAAITAAKIGLASVGITKLGASNSAVSSVCSVSTTSTSLVDATGLSVNITTVGRDVFVGLLPDTGSPGSYIGGSASGSTDARDMGGVFVILRGSTEIARVQVDTYFQAITTGGSNGGHAYVPPGSLFTVDMGLAAGSYTYKVQYLTIGTSHSAVIQACKLYAKEMP